MLSSPCWTSKTKTARNATKTEEEHVMKAISYDLAERSNEQFDRQGIVVNLDQNNKADRQKDMAISKEYSAYWG